MPLPSLRSFATDIVETSNTLGAGTYSLAGARTGYRSFADGYDTNDTPYYVVRPQTENGKYEHNRGGIFTDGSPDTLTRNVLYSSNGNAAVTWVSGDLPLNVYTPNAAEVFEFMVRGWVMDTRDAWLKFGNWFDSSVPNFATWKLFDGTNDIVLGKADLLAHTFSLDFRALPAGMEFAWSSTTIPAGMLEQNGQSLLRATYPALFALYGTTFGAADGTHFNVPDMRSRTVYGRDPNSTGRFDYTGRNTIGTAVGQQYHLHGVSVSGSCAVSVGGSASGTLSASTTGGYAGGNVTNVNASGPVATIDTTIVISSTGSASGTLGMGGTGAGSCSASGATDARDNVSPGMIKIWVVTTGGI